MKLIAACVLVSLSTSSAAALVGNAREVGSSGSGQHIVMVLGTRGSVCTGTALAPDVVLTAAHCVAPAATYRVFLPGMTPPGLSIRTIIVHPRYEARAYAGKRVTVDLALLNLDAPLPSGIRSAALARMTPIAHGDRFAIAGFGVTRDGSEAGIGIAREAALVATGKPGTLQIRLVDPATGGDRAGLGACTGDSGAPAFVVSEGGYALRGVVSWSTGPKTSAGCGGLTGLTPLDLHHGWIEREMARFRSPRP